MERKTFDGSLSESSPPNDLPDTLKSLWWDKKGDWDTAHRIAQSIHTGQGSAVHAYLHREEGDLGNASYWYNRAGRPVGSGPLDEEWERLVEEMLRD